LITTFLGIVKMNIVHDMARFQRMDFVHGSAKCVTYPVGQGLCIDIVARTRNNNTVVLHREVAFYDEDGDDNAFLLDYYRRLAKKLNADIPPVVVIVKKHKRYVGDVASLLQMMASA